MELRTSFPSTCSLLAGPTTSSCLQLTAPGTCTEAVARVFVCLCVGAWVRVCVCVCVCVRVCVCVCVCVCVFVSVCVVRVWGGGADFERDDQAPGVCVCVCVCTLSEEGWCVLRMEAAIAELKKIHTKIWHRPHACAVAQPIHTCIRMHSLTKLDSAGPLTTSQAPSPRQAVLPPPLARRYVCKSDSFFTKRMLICDYILGMWRLSVSPTFMHIPAAGLRGSWGLIRLVMYTRSLYIHTCAYTHTYIHKQSDSTTGGRWGGRWGVQIVGESNRHQVGVCVCVCVWNLSEEGVICFEDGVYYALYNWMRHSQKLDRPHTPVQEQYA